MAPSRANVVSSRNVMQPLIEETYQVFQKWDLSKSKKDNFKDLRLTNFLGVRSENWLKEKITTLKRRFDTDGSDRTLIELAQAHCPMRTWKPLLLWHMTRDEFLIRDFLTNWLYEQFIAGTWRVCGEDVEPYLKHLHTRDNILIKDQWTDRTTHDIATYLLRIAVQFDLMTGSRTREFVSYHLPDEAFLYLLHAAAEKQPNAYLLVNLPDWRMYLLGPDDVQRELFRLHQFRRLNYEVAGSIAELRLPYRTAAEYARAELIA